MVIKIIGGPGEFVQDPQRCGLRSCKERECRLAARAAGAGSPPARARPPAVPTAADCPRPGRNVPAIEASGLTKIFGRRPQRGVRMLNEGADRAQLRKEGLTPAVIDATFDVAPGEIFVVMGLSGSGKSTLIRMVNGLLEPTDGVMRIDGQDVTHLSAAGLREVRRTKVSMVFQHFALLPHRTVGENAAYPLKLRGVSKAEREAR